MTLGGVSIAMAHDVAETTLIPRPPKGREEVPVQISRLLHAHEIVLKEARTMGAAGGGSRGRLLHQRSRTPPWCVMQLWVFLGLAPPSPTHASPAPFMPCCPDPASTLVQMRWYHSVLPPIRYTEQWVYACLDANLCNNSSGGNDTSESTLHSSETSRGLLCSLPRNISTSLPCSQRVIAVLSDRVLISYLRRDDGYHSVTTLPQLASPNDHCL